MPGTSKSGRRRHLDPPVTWQINLPQSLAQRLEILLTDPIRGTIAHGSRSQLLVQLLREWLARQETETRL